ncbi:MAG TPA: gamma-glutamyl-gamma-aminobutyrate hydrolase family protein [Vicinamibacteria bacterium]|nr:gamma-glutamyl-gamma-aminobutyrate hydrolase family protein [Vicinamibacteria bacterium]
MTSPLIGIGTSFSNGIQRQRRAYADAVVRAGGLPVLLPMLEGVAGASELAKRLDGLVIPGGPGITKGTDCVLPAELPETGPERLRFDEAIARAFIAANKPVLGICYGMQLLNTLYGGTLYADVERELEGALVHSEKRGASEHPIAIDRESVLFDLIGKTELLVNSRHFQAVRHVSDNFRVSARAPDGVVEGIESLDGRLVGVQFHPESMGPVARGLFAHLVELA